MKTKFSFSRRAFWRLRWAARKSFWSQGCGLTLASIVSRYDAYNKLSLMIIIKCELSFHRCINCNLIIRRRSLWIQGCTSSVKVLCENLVNHRWLRSITWASYTSVCVVKFKFSFYFILGHYRDFSRSSLRRVVWASWCLR